MYSDEKIIKSTKLICGKEIIKIGNEKIVQICGETETTCDIKMECNDEMGYKMCITCKENLPESMFWIRPQTERKKCRICLDKISEKQQKFKNENPELYEIKKEKSRIQSAKKRYNPEAKYKYFHLRRVQEKNMEDEFEKDEFIRLFFLDKCYYCNYSNNDVVLCGADRVDTNKHYVRGNLVPCCKICNNMKGTIPVSIFINQCAKINKKIRNNPYVDLLEIPYIDGNANPSVSICGEN